jgi:hypothetical protein
MQSGVTIATWIQAGAAAVSCIVTVVLVLLTKKYVKTTEAISRANSEQVRNALAAADRQRRARAAALLEEIRRIRSVLWPDQPTDGTPVLPRGAIPSVHHWLEAIIPSAAETDPRIVQFFLRLDRSLANLGVTMTGVAKEEQTLQQHKNGLEETRRGHPHLSAEQFATFSTAVDLKNAISLGQTSVTAARRQAELACAAVQADLNTLDGLLSPAAVVAAANAGISLQSSPDLREGTE